MTQITIDVRDKKSAQLLLRLLQSLDFVEHVQTSDSLPVDDDAAHTWHQLSEPALIRLWDNKQDAVYDD